MRATVRRIDRTANAINEATGRHLPTEALYLAIIAALDPARDRFDDIDTAAIYRKLEGALWEHPPRLYDDRTADVLHTLAARPDTTLSLLSNTGFIKGPTLRQLLDRLGIGGCFAFQLYSDELALSKPDPRVFAAAQARVADTRGTHLSARELLHVGDNPRADYDGATRAGWTAYHVHADGRTLNDLL